MALEAVIAVSAAATVGSTVYSAVEQNKAAKAQQHALNARNRIAEMKNIQQRRDQVRQARIKRAQAENMAYASGTSTSTGSYGAQSSIDSQLGSNLSFIDAVRSNQVDIFMSQSKKAKYTMNADIGSSIASIGSDVFGAATKFAGASQTGNAGSQTNPSGNTAPWSISNSGLNN